MKSCSFKLATLLIIIMYVLGHISALNYENMTLLRSNLLTGYDNDVIPINNQSEKLIFTVGMSIYKVLEVDTVRGVVVLVVTLECYWHDERISWDEAAYGGIKSVKIKSKDVWTPDFVLAQPVEFTVMGESWMRVSYQSNGSAFWRPGGIIEMTCPMNLHYWPFDEQSCDLSFFAYDFWNAELDVRTIYFSSQLYQENGEWTLEKTDHGERNIYGSEEALFKISLRRRPVFYVLSLILPLFGFGMLSSFVFLLPSESGERVSYSITILLSLAVFLTVVADNMPKLSNPVPLFCVFLFVSIIMSKLATLIVIINLSIYHRSPDVKINYLYTVLVRLTQSQCRSNNIEHDEHDILSNGSKKATAGVNEIRKIKVAAINSVDMIEKVTMKNNYVHDNEMQNENESSKITWVDVSKAIDVIMFVFILVGQLIAGTIGLLIMILN